MQHRQIVTLLVLSLGMGLVSTLRAERPYKPVAEIMEDDAEGLLKHLDGQDRGLGTVETSDVFSGKAAIKITPMQRYSRSIPNWSYHITEHPKVGEYRYLRFAWKADGARGIMLQMHDEKDWNIRFTAGIDAYHWGTKFVADVPPDKWTVVTRDLFKEFGERKIQGIALTVFEGNAGYFDHIYFGRTIEDLDLIDATGLNGGPDLQIAGEQLEQLWRDLDGADAAKAYRAFWTLCAAPESSVPYLRKALTWAQNPGTAKQIQTWIMELDADSFQARENAARQLGDHLDAAAGALKKTLADGSAAAETCLRIEAILKRGDGAAAGMRRIDEGVRILSYTNTPEAKALLNELAHGDEHARVTLMAKARLERKKPVKQE